MIGTSSHDDIMNVSENNFRFNLNSCFDIKMVSRNEVEQDSSQRGLQ